MITSNFFTKFDWILTKGVAVTHVLLLNKRKIWSEILYVKPYNNNIFTDFWTLDPKKCAFTMDG